jgi:hypothetical protein
MDRVAVAQWGSGIPPVDRATSVPNLLKKTVRDAAFSPSRRTRVGDLVLSALARHVKTFLAAAIWRNRYPQGDVLALPAVTP